MLAILSPEEPVGDQDPVTGAETRRLIPTGQWVMVATVLT